MASKTLERKFRDLLVQADIEINGERPCDIQIHDPRVYRRVLTQASLGLGESYMEGWWGCEKLDAFFHHLFRARLEEKVRARTFFLFWLKAKLINVASPARAFRVGEQHYDIGNRLYQRMLDSRMIYSCAYWQGARNLDEAQEAKLELVCRKLELEAGMRVIDIGCGWGGTARYMAETHGVEVVGITVSKRQAELAREMCSGLPVEIRVQDYRDLDEKFDRAVSVGMFEHVGYKAYRTYFDVVRRCLKPHGLFLLHTIGANRSTCTGNAWMDRYIFANSMLPSIKQIARASEELFVMEDWFNMGDDYDKTLMAWYRNFIEAWPELEQNYNERFYRMWSYYLLCCAASFRARKNQVWQVVFSPRGVPGGYRATRIPPVPAP